MLKFVKDHGLEGVVAKRSDSVYQPGQRTGLWSKFRINRGQEFVIGGYVPNHLGVDSLVVGFYRGKDLVYAARVRAGLVPTTRHEVFERIKHLKTPNSPSACTFLAGGAGWVIMILSFLPCSGTQRPGAPAFTVPGVTAAQSPIALHKAPDFEVVLHIPVTMLPIWPGRGRLVVCLQRQRCGPTRLALAPPLLCPIPM
jgi:hypothetical protein